MITDFLKICNLSKRYLSLCKATDMEIGGNVGFEVLTAMAIESSIS
jgi:hypothetical protein